MTTGQAFEAFVLAADREAILSRRAFALCWDQHDSDEYTPSVCLDVLRARACHAPEDKTFPGLGLARERFETALQAARTEYEADPEGFIDGALYGGLWESGAALLAADLPPVYYVVDGFLPQGLCLLAAPPKFGKSWFCMALCVEVARGGWFLNQKCSPSPCLYLALEDSRNRLQERLAKVLRGAPCPPGFALATKADTLDSGLLAYLEVFMERFPTCKLIVIDTLQKVRGGGSRPGSAYADDYADMGALKDFADRFGLCLLLVHHLRKMADDTDPFNRIAGSNGLFGAADAAMVLTRPHRGDSQTTLNLTGRDVEEQELVVQFNKETFRWELLGDAETVKAQRLQAEYDENPIVCTINRSLDENGGHWETSGKGFIQGCAAWYGACPADTPQALTRQLAELAPLLWENDRIQYVKHGRGGTGKAYSFKRLSEEAAIFGNDQSAIGGENVKIEQICTN